MALNSGERIGIDALRVSGYDERREKCRTAQDTESLSGKQYEFQRDS